MKEFTNKISELFYGETHEDAINNNTCVVCKVKVTEFKNEVSMREYKISGFCQKCQDETFGA